MDIKKMSEQIEELINKMLEDKDGEHEECEECEKIDECVPCDAVAACEKCEMYDGCVMYPDFDVGADAVDLEKPFESVEVFYNQSDKPVNESVGVCIYDEHLDSSEAATILLKGAVAVMYEECGFKELGIDIKKFENDVCTGCMAGIVDAVESVITDKIENLDMKQMFVKLFEMFK